MAWESLTTDSHWFSWKRRALFFSCHRQAFKIVGSVSYVIHYLIQYQKGFERVICCIWTPRRACFRHWTSNCVKRIQSVLGVKWDQTHSFILNQMEQQRGEILKRSLMKNVLEADGKATLPLSHRLANFLIMCCSTTHTPEELYLKCQFQTCFSLFKPELTTHIEHKQSEQKWRHDHRTQPVFSEGDTVRIRNFVGGVNKMDL